MSFEIPTYDPEDPETDFPFDWQAHYEGEDPSVSSSRPVFEGHSIASTSWPREERLEDAV